MKYETPAYKWDVCYSLYKRSEKEKSFFRAVHNFEQPHIKNKKTAVQGAALFVA